jgi:hypothetical protein
MRGSTGGGLGAAAGGRQLRGQQTRRRTKKSSRNFRFPGHVDHIVLIGADHIIGARHDLAACPSAKPKPAGGITSSFSTKAYMQRCRAATMAWLKSAVALATGQGHLCEQRWCYCQDWQAVRPLAAAPAAQPTQLRAGPPAALPQPPTVGLDAAALLGHRCGLVVSSEGDGLAAATQHLQRRHPCKTVNRERAGAGLPLARNSGRTHPACAHSYSNRRHRAAAWQRPPHGQNRNQCTYD